MEGRFGRCFWSRDGREFVVTTYDTIQSDRTNWRVSADGKKSRELPIPATELVHDWSRDGLWLVTSSARLKPGETTRRPLAREELYVMHLDGTAEHHVGPTLAKAEVTKGTTLTVLPQFSPDGRTLLWGEADLGPSEGKGTSTTHRRLMLQSLAGGPPRRLLEYADRPGYMTSQCWSPDGRLIALHFAGNSIAASDGRIEVVDLEGKTVRTIGLQAFPDATQRSIHNLISWR
jgi:Tol biopolymer transport system component